jgi:hypothetical protein
LQPSVSVNHAVKCSLHRELPQAAGRAQLQQLLHNAKFLHGREAYEDSDVPAEQRHLLRLWLTAHHFTSVEDILRSGIPTRG